MSPTENIEHLAKKLCAALPASLHNLEQDIQKKFKEILQSAFSNLNLVTREEFDVQVKVLARTREKVDQLEKEIESSAAHNKK